MTFDEWEAANPWPEDQTVRDRVKDAWNAGVGDRVEYGRMVVAVCFGDGENPAMLWESEAEPILWQAEELFGNGERAYAWVCIGIHTVHMRLQAAAHAREESEVRTHVREALAALDQEVHHLEKTYPNFAGYGKEVPL